MRTGIASEAAWDVIHDQWGAIFAEVEDSATAVLHLAADNGANGKALRPAVVVNTNQCAKGEVLGLCLVKLQSVATLILAETSWTLSWRQLRSGMFLVEECIDVSLFTDLSSPTGGLLRLFAQHEILLYGHAVVSCYPRVLESAASLDHAHLECLRHARGYAWVTEYDAFREYCWQVPGCYVH